ncbi:hypothetical protein K227x_48490 [Rubripirellula lacrimiformis]|uniref:Uncharacterized protein n=1 Tax=Rubripirellula lacrimiformis TaxID=1930273 RepID=A0A517NH24_9BACT|nr:hypothetical protein K227x_48490 [Rubripirellula lacrimiformis]
MDPSERTGKKPTDRIGRFHHSARSPSGLVTMPDPKPLTDVFAGSLLAEYHLTPTWVTSGQIVQARSARPDSTAPRRIDPNRESRDGSMDSATGVDSLAPNPRGFDGGFRQLFQQLGQPPDQFLAIMGRRRGLQFVAQFQNECGVIIVPIALQLGRIDPRFGT